MGLNFIPNLRSFYDNAKHVLNVSYKPSMQHFQQTLKIVLIGTLLVGVMGYVISVLIGLIA
ncbi:MAG: protein translocase SEC61 complex subunit gamma [Candidatus Micrarchaeota archaeon]|nr:protein translocase SEC61 complex subunit gamma [Candidatus Micrarchaeota archaeon]